MKILHTSDLHIGKVVNGFSMIDDQRYILNQIIEIIKEEDVETILLSGDIYDKSIPTQEAVNLFNEFLSELYTLNLNILIISGNHDSADRLNFGQEILKDSRIFIESRFSGKISKVVLEDEYGPINFYLLPFVKPSQVNHALDLNLESYDEVVHYLVKAADIDTSERNIAMAHQFVIANHQEPELSESEVQSLGGMDHISHTIFKDYDYTALGHIHKPQAMGQQNIRYSGSILKYSFSEAEIPKSVTLLDVKEKGTLEITERELTPKTELLKIEATMADILNQKTFDQAPKDAYIHANILDEEEIINAVEKVRSVYPNVMQISFERMKDYQSNTPDLSTQEIETKSINDLFSDFFKEQYISELNETQLKFVNKIVEDLEEGDHHETD